MKHIVKEAVKGGIAEEMGVEPGDCLLSINNRPVRDVFDYRYGIADEAFEMTIEKPNGEQWILEVEKEAGEDLGILFESGPGLMDQAMRCANRCVFCFVDQLPENMRQTLYFKDDDARLSFLQGNYVTLTNMRPEDIDRLILYRLSPINISVHTTDPVLRKRMLQNKYADQLPSYIQRFAAAHIEMNFQIVLCKALNDQQHLDKTIQDLIAFIPAGKSLSVVPVGLTQYREGLYPLTPFGGKDAEAVLAQIHAWQRVCLARYGTRFVYAADEFYIQAQKPIPAYEAYEDFPQIENGVGMVASMRSDFEAALSRLRGDTVRRMFSWATGLAAFAIIQDFAARIEAKFPRTRIWVYPIVNDFFGESITVSGLLTGRDITAQLRGKPLGDVLYIPANCLRADDVVLLDDMTLRDMEAVLRVKVRPVSVEGQHWVSGMLGV